MNDSHSPAAPLLVVIALAALVAAGTILGSAPRPKQDVPAQPKSEWQTLFNGKDLAGWEITKFGGEGDVTVEDGRILLALGNDLTGVHTHQPIPYIDYEAEVDAMRVDGNDFFCGFTFPVNDKPCTLILGGWGGGVCGLSSLDSLDASENETTTYREFEKGRWYHVRLRVTADHIDAWVDDEHIVDVDIAGRKISVRWEVELSAPFGFSSWQTTAALRNIRIRPLRPEEKAAPQPTAG